MREKFLDNEMLDLMYRVSEQTENMGYYYPTLISIFSELNIKTSDLTDYMIVNNLAHEEDLNKYLIDITRNYIKEIEKALNKLKEQ